MLSINNLHISVDDTEIVKGVNLTINSGEVHAIMGPNGSGKSTLVNALMGHPAYTVISGTATLGEEDILSMPPEDRARRGLFLAFQYPKEISGVTLRSFLFAAYKQQMKGRHPDKNVSSPIKFAKLLEDTMQEVHMDPAFAERFINQGFSGGEKKKAEVLQMKILQPSLALLDETDSGLDVDALKVVAEGVNSLRGNSGFSALIVTHYARILEYIEPDFVHVMVDGKIEKSGGKEFAHELEKGGYRKWKVDNG